MSDSDGGFGLTSAVNQHSIVDGTSRFSREVELPSLDELVARLASIAGVDAAVDADTPIIDLPGDSLEIIQFLFEVAEDFGSDESAVDTVESESIFELSLRELYDG